MPQQHLDYGATDGSRSAFPTFRRVARRFWPLLLGLAVVAATVTFTVWRWSSLRVDDPAGFSSPSVVTQYTGVAPPAQATHIRTAGYSHGPIYSHYIRFEAPANVCLVYAQQLAAGSKLIPAEPDCMDSVLTHDRTLLTHLGWFDLPRATNLVGATSGATSGPTAGASIYVDQSRGIFYYFNGF
jgi:hypothetical protein